MTTAARFVWDELPRDQPMEKLDRARVVGAKAMLSHIVLHDGCHVPTHTHENEQFACVLSGRIRFGIGAEGTAERHEIEVGTGEVLHLPANVPHSATALERTEVLDVFSPPSATTGVDAHGGA